MRHYFYVVLISYSDKQYIENNAQKLVSHVCRLIVLAQHAFCTCFSGSAQEWSQCYTMLTTCETRFTQIFLGNCQLISFDEFPKKIFLGLQIELNLHLSKISIIDYRFLTCASQRNVSSLQSCHSNTSLARQCSARLISQFTEKNLNLFTKSYDNNVSTTLSHKLTFRTQ